MAKGVSDHVAYSHRVEWFEVLRSEAYGAIVSWIIENGYEYVGSPFELFSKTQFDTLSPEDWETEVYFPIQKK